MTTTIARAATAPEKALVRTKAQWSRLFLAGLENPPIVFQALINVAFVPADMDMLAAVAYDGVHYGAYTDIIPGMTVWFGTDWGLYDLGQGRVRKTPTSSVLYIGETSELNLTNNMYITVVDEFLLWQRHVKFVDETPFMDYDIGYTNQHTLPDPVPVMGPDAVVYLKDSGEKVTNGAFGADVSGWTASGGSPASLITLVSNHMHINRNSAAAGDHAYQVIPFVIKGKTYKYSVNIVSASGNWEYWLDGVKILDQTAGTGVHTGHITTANTSCRVAFRVTSSGSATLDVDDISLKQCELIAFDGSSSYVVDGTGITSHTWTATGGITVTGGSTATPTFEVLVAGRYRIKDHVLAANTKTADGYRTIFVYDKNYTPVQVGQLKNCRVDYATGGYSFQVTTKDSFLRTSYRDRARVLLFAEDHYDTSELSIGLIPGRENIVASGWMENENLTIDSKGGEFAFTVQGPHYWLRQMTGFPSGVEIGDGNWAAMPGLTVDKSVWHLLHWRSTATAVMDIVLTGDTRLAEFFAPATGISIWDQIMTIAQTSILATGGCDRFGRLFLAIDPQYTPVASRSWATVMDLEKGDWIDPISLTRVTVPPTSQIFESGVSVVGFAEGNSIFALYPGHAPGHYGQAENLPYLLFADQAQANALAALIGGQRNNPYTPISITLAGNNRLIDLFPRQFCSITFDPATNPRGLDVTIKIIPRSIEIQQEAKSGALRISVDFEAETFPLNSTTGDAPEMPAEPPVPPVIPIPPIPPIPPIIIPVPPVGLTSYIILTIDSFTGTVPPQVVYTKDFDSLYPHWFSWNAGLEIPLGQRTFPPCINQLEISQVSGKGFITFNVQTYEPEKGGCWVSDGIGLAWKQFLTPAQATTLLGFDPSWQGFVPGMSINRSAADEVMVICAATHGGTGQRPYGSAHGSSGALAAGMVIQDWGPAVYMFNVHYGHDKWIFCRPDGSFWRLSRSGLLELTHSSPPYTRTARASIDNPGFVTWNGTLIGYSPDNGDNINALTLHSPDTTVDFIACDPSGLYMIYGAHLSVAPWKSSDGGVTWSLLGTPAIWCNTAWCLGDPMEWVVQGGVGVWYTDDFGSTWQDRTGNLRDLLGVINWQATSIRSLRV
jgi:hypothetical protein